jgi:drug/metabolite transporter (DMT)-like permease
MFVLGCLMFGFPFTIYPIGQQWITSGAAGIINAMTPIMVVIVSHFWAGGERATWGKSAGVVAGFAGIVLLSVPAMQGTGASSLGGLMFTLLAPLCYGTAVNYVRRLSGTDPWVMLTWAFTFASSGLALVALIREGAPGPLGGETLAALAALGMMLTALAFIVFFWLLPRIGATNISTVTFIAPVSAVLLGVVLLGETVDIWKAAGMAAIFLGLLLIDGRILRWMRPKDQPIG